MIAPRRLNINGIDAVEQTLEEYVNVLAPDQCARLQYMEMKQRLIAANALSQQLEVLEKDKAELQKQLRQAQLELSKSTIQQKIQKAAIRKHYEAEELSKSQIALQNATTSAKQSKKKRKTLPGPASDDGHTL